MRTETAIHNILLPLDPSNFTDSAMTYGQQLARSHQAVLAGMTILDSPDIRQTTAPVTYSTWPAVQEAIREQRQHADEVLREVEDRFLSYCDENNVRSTIAEKEGVPVDLLIQSAALYDLMILGLRTFFHFETRDSDGELLDKVLQRSATPVLAVTEHPKALKKVLVAYDASPASARALRDFAVFAKPLEMEVDLFLANDDEYFLDLHASRAEAYLRSHGCPVGKVHRSAEPAVNCLHDGITDGYDLVVCGIHSHNKVRDFFVGSFARELIKRGSQCLFLSH